MRGGRRRADATSAHPRARAASRAVPATPAAPQPVRSWWCDVPAASTPRTVLSCGCRGALMPLVMTRGPGGTMPYGPLALTVLRGPGRTMPYGPLALTVLRGPGGMMPYGPLAWAVRPGPGGVTTDAAWGAFVAGD